MLVTNTTAQDYWFGPLHLLGGNGQTLTVDDTTATSLYLTDDVVADAINNLYNSGKITVSSAAAPFPRPTGVPSLLHGDGSPEGLVYAPQGSVYLRRDGTGANSLYTKTTGVTLNTGWENYTTTAVGPGTTYRKTTAKTVNNTVTETDLLNGEIAIGAGVMGTTGALRLTAWVDILNNTGGNVTFRWRVKFGATTILDTGALVFNTSTTRGAFRLAAEALNLGAANSQAWQGVIPSANNVAGGGSAWTTGESIGIAGQNFFDSSAEDTTVAKALQVTVQMGTASASAEAKLYGALVEII